MEEYPFLGVSQYPVEEWEKLGEPTMTVKGWLQIALAIGEQQEDACEVIELMDIAEKLVDAPPQVYEYNKKNLDKWHDQKQAMAVQKQVIARAVSSVPQASAWGMNLVPLPPVATPSSAMTDDPGEVVDDKEVSVVSVI